MGLGDWQSVNQREIVGFIMLFHPSMPNNKTVWEKSTALSTALTAALTAAAIKLDDTDSNGHEEQNSTSLELGNCCD